MSEKMVQKGPPKILSSMKLVNEKTGKNIVRMNFSRTLEINQSYSNQGRTYVKQIKNKQNLIKNSKLCDVFNSPYSILISSTSPFSSSTVALKTNSLAVTGKSRIGLEFLQGLILRELSLVDWTCGS